MKYRLENGKTFTIRAENVSPHNFYIASVQLNGMPYKKAFITHDDIMNGGTLEFEMSAEPARKAFVTLPESKIEYVDTVPMPSIDAENKVFADRLSVRLRSADAGAKLYYIVDEFPKPPAEGEPVYLTDAVSTPGYFYLPDSKKYTEEFFISESSRVTAIAVDAEGNRSKTAEAEFYKKPNDWKVIKISPYSTQYTGGGDNAIVDGIRGTVNFASGEWQGIQGKPFEAVIDLQRETEIKELGGSFLQAAGPWIWMPDRIDFETSNDGINFTHVAEIKPNFPQREMTPTIKEFTQAITPTKARYVRIRAYNIGKIPAWHPGAGGDPWIFVDEVFIR